MMQKQYSNTRGCCKKLHHWAALQELVFMRIVPVSPNFLCLTQQSSLAVISECDIQGQEEAVDIGVSRTRERERDTGGKVSLCQCCNLRVVSRSDNQICGSFCDSLTEDATLPLNTGMHFPSFLNLYNAIRKMRRTRERKRFIVAQKFHQSKRREGIQRDMK